ncbi:transcriptional regulator with XRE-family HTH domain [Paenarthrobacter nicotinovorans]|uniref:Transcriptional regulator with XRE-family HTH domain n=1 Tax=Paenarthrobacter nicotinovorans TaxID=29320 RepID=A0ABT9TLM6_PAENI|nr:helix-turn-helix transcriptional regulator [Paenarthrobacter nicotinovorans]MDQ0102558.1 transcriptional regulator with XRE-family HTH domain [Paenarthrobacter nicotinovorans]
MPNENDDRLEEADRSVLVEFGKHLRAVREGKGLSQDALSHEAGLHRTYVGAVERGERNPTFLSLQKYAKGLGLSVEDLTRGF